MAAKTNKEPKQRIMDAAISLFAQKGYAGVGVREIASKADVNIAMISYYFEGKLGILKAIIEEFFSHYSEILSDILWFHSSQTHPFRKADSSSGGKSPLERGLFVYKALS